MRRASRRRDIETVFNLEDEPVWEPLEQVARLARDSPQLPSFHEAEFMFMGTARHAESGLPIYLYKHRDTRRYLNLDAAGHAHGYCGGIDNDGVITYGGYRRYLSLAEALEHVEFSLFDAEPGLFRSFPPDEW